MLARHDAILNLTALLSRAPGADFEAVGEGLLAPSDDTLEALTLRLEGPLSWHLAVHGTGGGDDFLLEGSVSGTAVQECGRCLTEVATEVGASFILPTLYRPGVEELTLMEDRDDNEDVLVFGKPAVDFTALLSQLFAVEQPITVLCHEDCKGLSLDGVNLNDHPEHVEAAQPASKPSPFAALKDLDL